MALSILDGNQSPATLSTIVTGGQHISAHTVVSLGTQAITDMRSAVSGSVVSISNFPTTQPISGTVTANVISSPSLVGGGYSNFQDLISNNSFLVNGNVDIESINSALPTGTNRIGVVTIGGGSVTLGSSTAQIGSVTVGNTVTIAGTVTANPTGTQTIAGTVTANGLAVGSTLANVFPIGVDTLFSGVRAVTDLNGYRLPISLGDSSTVVSASLSAQLPAGTNQIGSVTASISNSVVTFYPMQGTSVSNTNFTSTTASTTLVSAVAGREVLTVFNEGAGNLHISPGATCTTISYQVRLSSGDYWECPAGQTSLAHTAVFATAGTARVTQVS